MVRLPAPLDAAEPKRDRASERDVAAVIRGDACVPANPVMFAAMAMRHLVAPLVVHAGGTSRLPPEAAAGLREAARIEVVRSELRDRELCRVLCELRAAHIPVVLMKGAHLAHSHYAEAYLRPRDDADLLIRPADREQAVALLRRIGYEHLPDITSDVVHGQLLFGRETAIRVLLDLHWRISAPRVAAGLLSFEEIEARAVDLPRLGPCARGPAPVHALALACIHQSAHHQTDLLLWMYDIWLLTSRFTDAEVEEFSQRAVERRMARLCLSALALSAAYFPSPQSAELIERLQAVRQAEPTAFLVDPWTPLRLFASDVASTRGWASRLRLVVAHLFPPPTYMRYAYGVSSAAWLPWLYGRRILLGSVRWLTGGSRTAPAPVRKPP